MSLSSIQVTRDTRLRLQQYKVGGMSYEDVLKAFMDAIGPEEFHHAYRAWQAEVAGNVRKSDKWKELSLD